MKLYRLKSGVLLESEGQHYHLGSRQWDTLINRDDLAAHLKGTIADHHPMEMVDAAHLLESELLAPIQSQEIWASGVTYYRSRDARMEESKEAGGANFYDKVYDAERPELFYKANAARTSGSGGIVKIRQDSRWNVPEPELTLYMSSSGKIVAYTIGNDMSSRDIEGENPLYLPQAKVYEGCAGLGPCLYVTDEPLPANTPIRLHIKRYGKTVVDESTARDQLKRELPELAGYLFRELDFPYGAFLMTGTGIVPDNFTLQTGDEIRISIGPIGTLVNWVGQNTRGYEHQTKQKSIPDDKKKDKHMLTGKQVIGNSDSQQSSQTFTAMNPTNGKALPVAFYEASPEEIDQAVRLAEKAFNAYRKTTFEARAGFLEKIGEEIMAAGELLIKRCMEETALPQARLEGERARTVNQLKLFASLLREGSWVGARIDTAQPERKPLPKPDVRQMKIALGPVGVFGASNFPLAFSVAGGDTASALAAGCPVVVKGHPAHPGTSELVGRAIVKAAHDSGMPEGVFSLLQGTSHEVGIGIVQHPLIKAVGFTGSFRGGKALFDLASKRKEPIPVYAEMGSTNPVFILPGAMEERGSDIAKGLAASVTLGVGQFCTNPGLIVTVSDSASDSFAKETADTLGQAQTAPMLTEGIRKAYEAGVQKLTSISGVKVLSGKDQDSNGLPSATLLTAPAKTVATNPEITEEVFGPSTVNLQAADKGELLELADGLEGHLTATLHATPEDLENYRDLVEILERKVGRLLINGFPTGVEVCHSMMHGGPFPATTDSRSTSVGTLAIDRFVRPISYQNFPDQLLPLALQNANPLDIWRMVNGGWTKDAAD